MNDFTKSAMYSVLTQITRIWSSTLNYSREGYDLTLELQRKNIPIIFAIYHGEVFPLCCLHQNEGIMVVVSRSRDGELIAGILERLGYNLARGSSSREGLRALLRTARQIREKKSDVVFTVDGPRGPRHKSKPGIIYLASRSRAYVVPARVAMSTRHVFEKSWDRFHLPWIWSSCRVVYGRPFQVPMRLNQQEINKWSLELDERLKLLL